MDLENMTIENAARGEFTRGVSLEKGWKNCFGPLPPKESS